MCSYHTIHLAKLRLCFLFSLLQYFFPLKAELVSWNLISFNEESLQSLIGRVYI